MLFVKSGFPCGSFWHTLNEYGLAVSKIRCSRFTSCVLQEQRVCASHEFGAGRKIFSSFVLLRGRSDEEEEIWVAKVLLLTRCILEGMGGALSLHSCSRWSVCGLCMALVGLWDTTVCGRRLRAAGEMRMN